MENTRSGIIKILFLLILASSQAPLLLGQFAVSSVNTSFFDAARNRNVSCGIYYPSVIDSVPGSTQFPYIIFGHGFSMGISSYEFFATGMVPEGVIVIMPSTETGLSPSHSIFAADMAFLAVHFYQSSLEAGSAFYQAVRPDFFLMGHSMGGGAAHLAAASVPTTRAVVTFAAAETDPSAIEAALNYNGKSILFYGENDNVTPLQDHQQPIYQNSGSACRFLLGIKGGVHCYFNDYNLACWIGEAAVGSVAEISREEQQDIVLDFLTLLVHSEFYGQGQNWELFLDSVNNSPRINSLFDCSTQGYGNQFIPDKFEIIPNPATDFIQINSGSTVPRQITILKLSGEIILTDWISGSKTISVASFPPGIYLVKSKNQVVRMAVI
jgi:dienelactone hydrolase